MDNASAFSTPILEKHPKDARFLLSMISRSLRYTELGDFDKDAVFSGFAELLGYQNIPDMGDTSEPSAEYNEEAYSASFDELKARLEAQQIEEALNRR